MQISSLRLVSFRGHAETEIEFAPGVNLLWGPNGAGKTNVLEAIHYLCLSKNFLTHPDKIAVRHGAEHFELTASFTGQRRPNTKVRLVFLKGEGKRLFVNGSQLERASDLIGMLPVVVYSPMDYAITNEGPEYRRQFLNKALSQSQGAYLTELQRYRRILKQRNIILSNRYPSADASQLGAWTEQLIESGSRIVTARHQFLQLFSGFLEGAYRLMEKATEEPTIRYRTFVDEDVLVAGFDGVREQYARQLHSVATRESAMGRTLYGPHRDDLIFSLNEMEVRRYASQGQHRTFGLALQLALTTYLRDHLEEMPILMLDDLFGVLDQHRTNQFLELLSGDEVGQSIITGAQRDPFRTSGVLDREDANAVNIVQGGVFQA